MVVSPDEGLAVTTLGRSYVDGYTVNFCFACQVYDASDPTFSTMIGIDNLIFT